MAAFLAVMPCESYAQGFLGKLKQKAENKFLNAVGVKTEEEAPEEEPVQDNGEQAFQQPASATDKIPKLRRSNVVWDGEVKPSSAADYRALMDELPQLPSVEDMINPDEHAKQAYMNKLYSLSMRAEELDDMYTCSDEEIIAARDMLYKEMEGITGLTAEEMVRLDDPNTSDTERERLEKKMMDHVVGDADMAAVEAAAVRNEARMMEISKELEGYEDRARKNQLTEAEQARIQELTDEMMQMQQEMLGGMGNIMNVGTQANQLTSKLMNQFEGPLKDYTSKADAIRKDESSVKDCGQIAAEYEKELKALYQQIWDADNASEVHALYDKADDLMRNYRTRAAKVYREGLATRLLNMKALLPEAEQLYSSMAEDGMIPDCSVKRAPLNVVIECINILESAYNDFPQPQVLAYKTQTIDIGLKKDEYICVGESGYGGSFARGGIGSMASDGTVMEEDFIRNSTFLVYNSAEQCYYKLNGGVRVRLEGNGPFDYHMPQKRDDSAYGEIHLGGGGRKAVYGRDGCLTLHDGTVCHPIAIQKNGDWLNFITDDGGGRFEVCSYRL